jgi:hypothetical protein
VYYEQGMESNLAANLSAHIDEIGRARIADSPSRGEPECRRTKPIEKSFARLTRETHEFPGAFR